MTQLENDLIGDWGQLGHSPMLIVTPLSSILWFNMWKSQGGSQVNLCPRAVPRVLNLTLGVD